MIEFSWDIHHSCNYRCPYCWFSDKWDDISKNNVYPGLRRLVQIWNRVYDRYGCVRIQINGGEPFTYPDFSELITEISKIHKICITTNLSGDVEHFLERISKNNVSLGMSFHPLFADLNAFLKKVLIIKNSGVASNILFLAWPPQLEKLLEYKRIFEDLEITFCILTFWGKYGGNNYPSGYTEQERRSLESILGARDESGEKFQLMPKITKGKLCHAGQTYALIHPNGNVYRCGGGNWKVQHEPFSNIFDGNFSLLNEPLPCDSEECPCNEWSFLLADIQNEPLFEK